ncbi:6841_t:CDS:2, partial [Entrophospora sp. SA101]
VYPSNIQPIQPIIIPLDENSNNLMGVDYSVENNDNFTGHYLINNANIPQQNLSNSIIPNNNNFSAHNLASHMVNNRLNAPNNTRDQLILIANQLQHIAIAVYFEILPQALFAHSYKNYPRKPQESAFIRTELVFII